MNEKLENIANVQKSDLFREPVSLLDLPGFDFQGSISNIIFEPKPHKKISDNVSKDD